MVARAAGVVAAVLLASASLAGDWQLDPSRVHEFQVSSELPAPASASEISWVASLIENLRRGGNRPDHVYRFAATAAKYTVSGVTEDVLVCVYRADPTIFIILRDAAPTFIVNFSTESVFMAGWGRVYVPPSRSFCTVVLDYETEFHGIPVIGEPGNPSFRDRTAKWH